MAKRALICGGGISGLMAGVSLTRIGWDVTIFEREPEIRAAGAGLNLWPNGGRVVKALGLGEEYRQISLPLQRYCTYSSDGTQIGVQDVSDWPQRYGAPLTGVYRRDLNSMLADAAGRGRILLSRRLVHFDDYGDEIRCEFENGEHAVGDLLVGADGVRSAARKVMFGAQEFRYDGLVRWRGMFDLEASGVDPDAEVEVLGDNGHLGYLPIGRGRAYWFAAAAGYEHARDAVCDFFASWKGSIVPAVIAATDRRTVIRNSLQDFVTPLHSWVRSRAVLVGDAAHPMLPGMAQGANQALEDVAALTHALDTIDGVDAALRSYEERRLPTVAPIVRLSRSLFDFTDQHHEYETHSTNLIFSRYDRYVEGVVPDGEDRGHSRLSAPPAQSPRPPSGDARN